MSPLAQVFPPEIINVNVTIVGSLVSISFGGPERSRRGTAVYSSEKNTRNLYKSKPTFRPLPPTAADMQQGLSAAKVFFEQIETWGIRFNYFPEFQNYFILYFKKYAS